MSDLAASRIDRIVVGHDGSTGAVEACAWTATLAAQLGAAVTVVRAYNPLDELGHVEPPVDFPALERAAAAELDEQWSAPLRQAGVAVRTVLVEGDPIAVLAQVVTDDEADLVVVGSHGRTGWRERILGRVASKLPHAVACPVVIVPQPEPS